MSSAVQENKNRTGPVQTLAHYLYPLRIHALLLAFLLLSGIALELIAPQVLRVFIDTASSGGSQALLLRAALLYIGVALLRLTLGGFGAYQAENLGWLATNAMRQDLLRRLLSLDLSFFKQHTPGELIERVDSDVLALINFFSAFAINLLGNGLLSLSILALLFHVDLRLGLGIGLYFLLALLALDRIRHWALPVWMAARQANAEQFGFLEEHISGAEELRSIGAEPYAMRRLYQLMRSFLKTNRLAFLYNNLASNSVNLLSALGYTFGLAVGVILYTQGQASLGSAYMIVTYIGMLADPLQKIQRQIQDFQKASASLQRVSELFSLHPSAESSPPQAGLSLPAGALSLSFDRVSFHYEQDSGDVLKETSFSLPAGRVLGVIGRTGSGKTTLTRLLFRLYDPSAGSIRLGGVDTCQAAFEELRSRVALVTQDVQLFRSSVRENLTLFRPGITDERLRQALQGLGLWEWVQSLPEGLDTRLASGGHGLSAGEAQLLAFGRAFLKDPALVVLDEASSRLDPATETRLEQAVDRLLEGRTALVVAHRLRTLQRADDILILENGQVVEFGPRRQLASDPNSRFYSLLHTGLEEVLA